MTPKIALVAALLVLASCRRDVLVARVAEGVSPLGELTDIRLGMRADELVRARPRARIASYFGYEEDLGPSHLSYEVPGSVNDGQAPPESSHLQSVTASLPLDDAPDPLQQWRAKVRAVATVTGTDPTCYQLHWPTATAWLAVWRRGGGELFVLGQPAVGIPGGQVTPPGMRVGVVRRGKSVDHAYSQATETDCGRMGDVDSTAPRSTQR
jgi:hypothetical protein